MTDTPVNDKRMRRSEETQKALIYQLEHVREEFGMELFVLADHNGRVVAFAGDKEAAEILAIFAQSLAGGSPPDPTLTAVLPGLAPENIVAESITLDELPLFLCAIMESDEEGRRGFERARDGIQRIYYTTSAFDDSP